MSDSLPAVNNRQRNYPFILPWAGVHLKPEIFRGRINLCVFYAECASIRLSFNKEEEEEEEEALRQASYDDKVLSSSSSIVPCPALCALFFILLTDYTLL